MFLFLQSKKSLNLRLQKNEIVFNNYIFKHLKELQ